MAIKLPALILLATIVPLSIFGLVTVRASYKALTREAGRANIQLAWQEVREIESYIQRIEQNLTVALAHQSFADEEYGEQEYVLQSLLRLLPEVQSLSVLDATGQERTKVSRQRTFLPEDLTNRVDAPAFVQAMLGQLYLGPIFSSLSGQPYISISIPIWDLPHERVIGVLIADVLLRDLLNAVEQTGVEQQGYVFVTDEQGHIIAHPDSSLVLRSSDFSRHPLVKRLLAGGDTDETPLIITDTGVEVLSVGVRSSKPDWVVIVEQPTEEALADVYQVQANLVMTLILLLILAGFLAAYFATHMVQPLRALEKGAQRIGGGDLDHRISTYSRDEMGQAAQAFNDMASELQTSQTRNFHSRPPAAHVEPGGQRSATSTN